MLNGLAFSIAGHEPLQWHTWVGSAISEFSFSNIFVQIIPRISSLKMWLQKLVYHGNKCWVQIGKFICFACMLLFYFLPFWTHYHKRLVVFYNIFLPIVNVFWGGLWGLDNVRVKFMFSKKATKIEEIFPVDLTLCSKCQIDDEGIVNFCGLLRK